MIRHLKRLMLSVVLGMVVIASDVSLASDPTPNEIVETAAQSVLDAIDGKREHLKEHPEELYSLIEEVLVPRFDRAYSARLVLGKHWRSASTEQKKRFVEAFHQSLLAQYAEGMLDFTAEKLKVLPFRGDPEKSKVKVRTLVTLEDGKEVPVNYSLRRTDDGWKVWDVIVEGISYVKNYRTDFNTEIRAKGLDAVITRLESKVEPNSGAS